MKIWCVASPPIGRLDAKIFSPLASIRLRCLEIIPELIKLGSKVTLVTTDQLEDRLENGDHRGCDVCIVYKILTDISEELDVIKSAGARVIVDITEHLEENRRSSAFVLAIFAHADLVTVSAPGLGTLLGSMTSSPVRLIFDSIEGPGALEPRAIPTDTLNLLWFGRSGNLNPLYDFVTRYEPGLEMIRLKLRIVTDVDGVAIDRLKGKIQTETLDWSPHVLRDQFAWSHAAIFPTSGAKIEIAKSTNRVQQTLWECRLPICEIKNGYGKMLEFGLFGDRLEAILASVVTKWSSLSRLVEAGRLEVEQNLARLH